MTLNWRHKTGLFLTLVAVGIGLFLDASAKQAVGITLLGIAFSWLIGSLTPRAFGVMFAILLCAVGLYVAADPIWSDWESVQKTASEYDLAIHELQSAVKQAGGTLVNTSRIVTIPESVKRWVRPEQKTQDSFT
jgi:hypothetical protein